MTDYLEEQNNELEALESIYTNELSDVTRTPITSFNLLFQTRASAEIEKVTLCVKFSLPSKYPDVIPDIEIVESTTLEEDHLNMLLDFMKEIAEMNVGIVMVFTIASALQDKLIELTEELVKNKRDEEERRVREAEEAEMKRFEGTKVNIESFLSWKLKFDEELLEKKKQKIKEDVGPKRLTGKELFMKDHAMDDSDIKFLEEGDAVEVDESLFQDIDSLDIDEISD